MTQCLEDLQSRLLRSAWRVGDFLSWVQHPTFTGGLLLVCITEGELPIFGSLVGSMEPDDHREHWDRVHESVERLAARHTIDKSQVSSWQSRSIIEHQFGGAIVANDFVVGFSGPKEHLSEVVSLLIALDVGLLDHAQATNIVTMSDNPLYTELYGHWLSYCRSQDEE